MTTSNIEKVLTVFRGIAGRDPDLTTKYMNPAEYKQHNPHVADGVEGLREYIRQFPRENHHLKVVRTFEDGPYVFAQEEGLILGQSVFFDLFRFEDGLIVEHCVFSAKGAPPNQSGHTQTDGPTEAKLSEDTEKNKSIVREYYETIHISGDHIRSRNTFPEIIASATNPGSATESRHSNVTWQNSPNTEASMRSSSCWGRETSFL
jgi:predicted SnoaL-like aldol condensation-catalyzing enzyme